MIRKALCNSPFLVCVTFTVWCAGIVLPIIGLATTEAAQIARFAAAVPILLLANRKTLRLGEREPFVRNYTIDDMRSRWTSEDGWDKEMEANNQGFIQQMEDLKAKRTSIKLTIIGVLYFIIVQVVIS